ncbi:MAG: conjugative transposon protein TraM [Bacteroidota bacterium]
MKAITHSPKFLKQRRFLTMLPVLVMPFATILFVLLGGGKGKEANAVPVQAGLNRSLPEAKLENLALADKLGYYEHAAKDSANTAEQMKYDPYLTQVIVPEQQASGLSTAHLKSNSSYGPYQEQAEEKIYRKLQQLNQVISQPEPLAANPEKEKNVTGSQAGVNSRDIDRLQSMMQQMQGGTADDPELSQLQAMLEKIQQIQHTELLSKKPVPDSPAPLAKIYQTIPAVIAKNQKVTEGTVVELRLLDSVRFNGWLIPKGHQVYGIAQLSNQRMTLRIATIGMGRSIIPVDLSVIDQRDNMEGIYVPEAATGDAIRGGTDNALQGLQVLPMDQTVGTQLAGAGISAAKGLFSKKVKLLKGKISAGYPVLIRINQ